MVIGAGAADACPAVIPNVMSDRNMANVSKTLLIIRWIIFSSSCFRMCTDGCGGLTPPVASAVRNDHLLENDSRASTAGSNPKAAG